MLAGDGVNLFDIVVHMHGLGEYADEKKRGVRVSLGEFKVTALSLEQIIESKRATGRQKDRLVLPVLSDALKAARKSSRSRRKPRRT
jgi:hypothetical protein